MQLNSSTSKDVGFMGKKRAFILLMGIICMLAAPTYGQTYRINNIVDSLQRNAHVVVRFDSVYVYIKDINGYTYHEEKVISVLDPSLEKLGGAVVPYSDRENIKSFKAWLFDADGNMVKQAGMNDAVDISIADKVLAGSNRALAINLQKLKPPFTVKYIVEKEVAGTAFMPIWMPAPVCNQSIESATLTVQHQPHMEVKYNTVDLPQPQITSNQFIWQVKGFKAIKDAAYSLPCSSLQPSAELMLKEFKLYNVEGSSAQWTDIGKFINSIAHENLDLKKISDHELNAIFDSGKSDIEKTKNLFSYLEHNFHYAGIEVGIGGWKPEQAINTLKKKYGDCKALVTVMKAMLKRAGIESYYTLVNAESSDKDVKGDFPCLDFNHVILCVPVPGDTLWLECTSQVTPFNYLYASTTNRHGLLVYEGGARLIFIPPHLNNYKTCSSHLTFKQDSETGNVISAVALRRGELQDTLRFLNDQNDKKVTGAFIYHSLNLQNTVVNSFTIAPVNQDSALVIISLDLSNEIAIKKTDARIFIKTDLLAPIINVPAKNEARNDAIDISSGYVQTDTLVYNLLPGYAPENFKTEEERINTSMFGETSCKISYTAEIGLLSVIRSYKLKPGNYPGSEYSNFRNFLLQAQKSIAPELVLKKKG